MTDDTTTLLDTREAAEYLKMSPGTLTVYRGKGRGPKFVRAGRRVLYRRSDLDAYLEHQEAAVTHAAHRAVAASAALSDLTDDELNSVLFSVMKAQAVARKAGQPRIREWWERLAEFILAEHTAREAAPDLPDAVKAVKDAEPSQRMPVA